MKKRISAIMLTVALFSAFAAPIQAEEDLPQNGKMVKGFTVSEITENKTINSDIVLFTHKKTGAEVLYISNDDTNRTFDIAFRTPANDKGVSHVFEHASLNGSEKYPADIFFNLSRQTAVTYMNAVTTMRTTYYPISSVSDEQLLRLTDYYLDGVFHPLIQTDKSIFDTEAWRYELSSPGDELTLNGTVYSEMKGSVTSDSRPYFNTIKTLFPDSNQAVISGGDPDLIPTLTYEEVVQYHDDYYKPSNALIILYGDVDYEKYLELFDSYFSEYDNKKPDTSDKDYKPIKGHVEKEFELEGGSGTTICYAIPLSADNEEDIFGLRMCGSIINLSSSEYKQRIREKLPKANAAVGFDTSSTEPMMYFSVSNVTAEDKDIFKETVDESIRKVVSDGFGDEVIDSFAASFERATLMSSPNGVSYAENINSMWGLSGDPFEYFDFLDYITNIKENTADNRLEKLLKKYIMNAGRSALTVNIPNEQSAAEKETELKIRLSEAKKNMTDEEIAQIIKRTTEGTPKNADAWELVKQINVSDVETLREELGNFKTEEYPYDDEMIGNVRHLTANADIGDIGIGRVYFDISALTDEQLMYFSLYDNLLSMLPGINYSQPELYNLLARYISGGSKLLPADDKLYYTFNMVMLNDDIEKTYDVLYELLFNSDLTDTELIKSLVQRMAAAAEDTVSSSATSIILSRARAQGGEKAAIYEYTSGLTYVEFIKKAAMELEENPNAVTDKIYEAVDILKNKCNAVSVFAGNDDGIELYKKAATEFFSSIPYAEREAAKRNIPVPEGSEAIIIDSDVNYNLIAAPLSKIGADRDGELYVTEKIVDDKLLIPQLRYNKGAYGTSYDVNEYGMYVSSYRDPQMKDTFDYFDELGNDLADIELTQEELNGYIISSFVGSAVTRGLLDDTYHYLTTKVYTSEKDNYVKLRERLDTTVEKVRDYSSVYNALAEKGVRYAIGRENDIIANADLFNTILIPFGSGDVYIYVNGERIETDTAPVIKNGRALVPVRVISEALGAEVKWDDELKTVTISGDRDITMTIGKTEYSINLKEAYMDTAPEIINERAMIPLRAAAEALDRAVDWKKGCIVVK